MSEPLDHHGPLEGMCFLGLNFTHEQFGSIAREITERMDPKAEHGVEGAIVSAFAEVARLRGVIEDAAKWIDTESVDDCGNAVFVSVDDEYVAKAAELRAALSPQPVQGGGE